jgi:hypothetical protein
MLMREFPGISQDWLGYRSLSQMLKKNCLLKVEKVGDRTLAWREEPPA